jgi:DNA-binding transcriptional ArsR family regulator
MTVMDVVTIAAIASALADPTRLQVWERSTGTLSISDLAAELGVTGSDVSYHVGRLRDVGLVEIRRHGRRHHPRRVEDGLRPLLRALG